MEYTSNFGSDARLQDKNKVSIPQNNPLGIDSKDNQFTYIPVVPGTHNITIVVSDQEGNSESTVCQSIRNSQWSSKAYLTKSRMKTYDEIEQEA
ncbi:MAG: hypothetical protein DHS20C17_01010 [Cyclobacteriaceae bacterium]|nr:MAG: hypothetical protein DHS20C17_01010 [Cyclobacteriaceae bacterium]